ncbi:hypothetical protein [Gramella sp. AN32]|uniref:Uncharacterized protein n=1 Tax=Christiangramia antarctica TaxID=2058158 RepID=A0ABW5X3K3_9FLAO|nr:hypothetical protein [Gramella sp. AN32]MCM4157147.1 hypothetical protein [Gramella sp. AN32]
MTKIKTLLAYCGIFTLLFASCSKDEPAQLGDVPTGEDFAVLTFNSVLNDLANRSMSKAHFDQVPDCSNETPSSVEITYSVGNGASETVTVAVLSENGDYFTAYSEDLKVLIPSGGSVMVNLEGFKVYSGSNSLIWVAPVRTNGDADQFDGYVEQSLPFSTEVFAGTKPYIDVEVLCFDRRMANEYGYVFFDIIPKTIYPLCLFANYCNADGRHWVADYSIDLYYGVSENNRTQLYSNTQESAMATTSMIEGEFQADPLCLVIPGPPANLANDMPYLTLIVYPMDWNATGSYGDIDNSGVKIQLSWNDVNGLLNTDGTTNEYLHILLGACEDALTGDGTMNPGGGTGGGGNDCVASDPEADCDDDTIPNKCDIDSPFYNTFDCDGDGTLNGDENQGCVDDTDPNCGVTVEPATCDLTITALPQGCLRGIIDGQSGASFTSISGDTGIPMVDANASATLDIGTLGLTRDADGNIDYTFTVGSANVSHYVIKIKDSSDGDVVCVDESDDNSQIEGNFVYPILVWLEANVCPTN